MAIIGIILSVMYLILMILLIATIGWEALQNPELMQEKIIEMQGV